MLFTNSRSYVSTVNNDNVNVGSVKNTQPTMMMFKRTTVSSSKKTDSHTKEAPVSNTLPVPQPTHKKRYNAFAQSRIPKQPTPPVEERKILWGEPFWNLLHLIAEKVKEEEFPKVRAEILRIIFTICSNLPCPDCTSHAVHYLNGINFNNIQTKIQLKDMLHRFHNAVNVRKHRPLFPRDQVDEKYAKGNFKANLDRFFYFFSMKHHSVRLITNDLHRSRITKNLRLWFQENIHCFET